MFRVDDTARWELYRLPTGGVVVYVIAGFMRVDHLPGSERRYRV